LRDSGVANASSNFAPIAAVEISKMKRPVFAAILLATSTFAAHAAVNVPQEALDQYEAYCRDEFDVPSGKMFEFCVQQERDGYARLVDVINKYHDKPWIQPLLDYFVREWTEKGLRRDSAVAANMEVETNAYEDIVYEIRQPSFDKAKLTSCFADWGIRFTQLLECYKEYDPRGPAAAKKQSFKIEAIFPEIAKGS
jgi:hypothetical protein